MSIQGKLLIATPKLDQTMFQKTVVYLFDHNPRVGAQGLVVNRPSKKTTIAKLIDDIELATNPVLDEPIFHGGPIAERTVTMLHSSEWFSANTRVVSQDFSISSDRFMLEKLATGNTPNQWLMASGKCAWTPGQLENEIEKGAWLTIAAKPAITFSGGSESLWKLCVDLCADEMINTYF